VRLQPDNQISYAMWKKMVQIKQKKIRWFKEAGKIKEP
jgi:hypothetical protein